MHHSVTMTGDSVESHVSSSVLLVETPVERFSETESSVNDKRTRVIAERTKHDAADSVKVKHKKPSYTPFGGFSSKFSYRRVWCPN